MMNKKGTTLAEVIISIALISVVLIFMVRLLIDLNNLENNTTYAKNNQINRAEILRYINNDLNNKVLTNIIDNSNENNLDVTFEFIDGTSSQISATNDTFYYRDSTEDYRVWDIEEGSIYVNRVNVYYSPDSKVEENKIYTLIIDIEIHTINEKNDVNNNNTLDDIIISYISNVEDFSNSLTCLGYDCQY